MKDSDTFEKILNKINMPESETKKVLTNISKFKSLNKVYKNQKISFKIDRKEPIKILEFSIEKSKTKKIAFLRDSSADSFSHKEIITKLKKVNVYREGEITTSLYSKAVALGVKPNIIV